MSPKRSPAETRPDPIYQVVFNLTRELWVLKDRQLILEAVLKQAGIDAGELIERYQPDADMAQRLDSERRQLLDRVFEPLESEN